MSIRKHYPVSDDGDERRLMDYKAEVAKLRRQVLSLRGKLRGYHILHDGLSDMIEGGRLKEADIPDDYRWLVETLVRRVRTNAGKEYTREGAK